MMIAITIYDDDVVVVVDDEEEDEDDKLRLTPHISSLVASLST